jgi:hypothetical protein
MHIRRDDLSGPQVRALLEEHLQSMMQLSPPESVHALDLQGLRRPDVTFWTLWDADELAGCGALKELSPTHGEIKSMRTALAHRRKGVARSGFADANFRDGQEEAIRHVVEGRGRLLADSKRPAGARTTRDAGPVPLTLTPRRSCC